MRDREDIITPNADCNAELNTLFQKMSGTLQTLSDNTRKLKIIAERTKKRLADQQRLSQICSNEAKSQVSNSSKY